MSLRGRYGAGGGEASSRVGIFRPFSRVPPGSAGLFSGSAGFSRVPAGFPSGSFFWELSSESITSGVRLEKTHFKGSLTLSKGVLGAATIVA